MQPESGRTGRIRPHRETSLQTDRHTQAERQYGQTSKVELTQLLT